MPLTRQSRVILAEMDGDPGWWDDVFDRVACGDRLKDIAAEYNVLAGQMAAWIERRPELSLLYDVALKARGNLCAEDILSIADGDVPMSDGTVATESRDRLRMDARDRMAASWNRARYGKAAGGVSVSVGGRSLIAILSGIDDMPRPAIESTAALVVDVGCAGDSAPAAIAENRHQPPTGEWL